MALTNLDFQVSQTFLFPQDLPGGTTFTIQVADSINNLATATLSIVLREEAQNHLVTRSDDDEDPGSLSGTIAVVEADLTPDVAFSLERRGAVAQIFLTPGERVQPRNCSTIWGTPTHESAPRRPRTPIVMVARHAGEGLREGAIRGLDAHVSTNLREGWTGSPVLVADIHGAHDPDEFVLVHGSDDTVCLPAAASFMAQQLPTADLRMFEGCGHAPFLSHPEEFNAVLAQFFAGLYP